MLRFVKQVACQFRQKTRRRTISHCDPCSCDCEFAKVMPRIRKGINPAQDGLCWHSCTPTTPKKQTNQIDSAYSIDTYVWNCMNGSHRLLPLANHDRVFYLPDSDRVTTRFFNIRRRIIFAICRQDPKYQHALQERDRAVEIVRAALHSTPNVIRTWVQHFDHKFDSWRKKTLNILSQRWFVLMISPVTSLLDEYLKMRHLLFLEQIHGRLSLKKMPTFHFSLGKRQTNFPHAGIPGTADRLPKVLCWFARFEIWRRGTMAILHPNLCIWDRDTVNRQIESDRLVGR